jgi:hypothetical protein
LVSAGIITVEKKMFVHAWKPTAAEEIYILLGLLVLMCIIQKPCLQSYFSTKRMVAALGFGDIIARYRQELQCKFLHFSDSKSQNTNQGPPKLFKIFSIISHLSNKFYILYFPYQNISVDESLTLWEGHPSFGHFLPLKFSQCGIESFELCDFANRVFVVCAHLHWEKKKTRIITHYS